MSEQTYKVKLLRTREIEDPMFEKVWEFRRLEERMEFCMTYDPLLVTEFFKDVRGRVFDHRVRKITFELVARFPCNDGFYYYVMKDLNT